MIMGWRSIAAAGLTLVLASSAAEPAPRTTWPEGEVVRCDSEVVTWAMYEPKSRTLTMRLRRGGLYEFYGVPVEVYREFMSAPQKGGFVKGRLHGVYSSRSATFNDDRPPP